MGCRAKSVKSVSMRPLMASPRASSAMAARSHPIAGERAVLNVMLEKSPVRTVHSARIAQRDPSLVLEVQNVRHV